VHASSDKFATVAPLALPSLQQLLHGWTWHWTYLVYTVLIWQTTYILYTFWWKAPVRSRSPFFANSKVDSNRLA
jgi:hypothetical protein